MRVIQAKGLRPGDEYVDIYSSREQTEHVCAVRRYCSGEMAWVEVDTLSASELSYNYGELVVVV